MARRWYLSGPITGYPDLNRQAFTSAARELRGSGWDVSNPFDVAINTPAEWVECLRADLQELLLCSGIIMLQGWPQSRGARLELSTALALDYPVMFYDGIHGHSPIDMNRIWHEALPRS